MDDEFSAQELQLIAEVARAVAGTIDSLPDKWLAIVKIDSAERRRLRSSSGFALKLRELFRRGNQRLCAGDIGGFVRTIRLSYERAGEYSGPGWPGGLLDAEQIVAAVAATWSVLDEEIDGFFGSEAARASDMRMACAKLRSVVLSNFAGLRLRSRVRQFGGDGQVIQTTERTISKSISGGRPSATGVPEGAQKFALMVEPVSDYGIFTIGTEGCVETWNQGAKRILGYPAEDIIGRGYGCLYSVEDQVAGKPAHALRRAAVFGRFEDTGTRVRKDGSRLVAHLILTAVYGKDGILFGFLETIRDVTEERREYEELRRSEAKFRGFFDNHADAASINRLSDGRYIAVNDALLRLSGYSRDEIIGRTALELEAWLEREDLAQLLNSLQRNGRVNDFELRTHARSGATIPVLVSAAVVELGGEPCIVSVARDISERKRFEREMIEARDAALEAARMKAYFLANVSHEIRTPLNVLLGCAEEIVDYLEGLGDASLSPLMSTGRRAGSRLLRTINAILDLSRIESHSFKINPEQLRIADIVAQQVGNLAELAGEKGVEIRVQIDEPEAIVELDRHCLSNAVANLLHNAIKFTERGEILIWVFRNPAGYLSLEVRDTGIGIDPAYLPRLFEPFTQESSGDTRRFEGSGLGLALAKRYLELNRATVAVSSEKGRGSTFTIVLKSD